MTLNFRVLLRDFRLKVAAVLILVWIFSLILNFSWQFLFFPLEGIFFVSLFDFIFVVLKKEKIRFPSASLVTGLILGLILFPFEHTLSLPLAALAASFSKQFIHIQKRHIFNPASFGAVLTLLSLGVSVSWWSPSSTLWTIAPVFIGMGFILFKLKRLLLPFGFLLTYGLYLYLRVGGEATTSTLFDPTTVFFSFVMVPELATSPASGSWKYIFGPLVAIFVIFLSALRLLPEVFLPALLFANLFSTIARRLFKLG